MAFSTVATDSAFRPSILYGTRRSTPPNPSGSSPLPTVARRELLALEAAEDVRRALPAHRGGAEHDVAGAAAGEHQRVVGLDVLRAVAGGLHELDVVGDRLRAVPGDARQGARERQAREHPALLELVERHVVDADDHDVLRDGPLAADLEARVDGRELGAVEGVGGVEQHHDRDREQGHAGEHRAAQAAGGRAAAHRSDANRAAPDFLDSPLPWPRASRSSTISCSTSAAPSGCSRRSATPGPRPTSSRRSTTRRAPRGASPTAPSAPRSCSGCARPRARSAPLLPFYPHAVESFDLRGYDTVISSSSAWAHGVLVDPGAVHVCYCHNPFRYAWTEREATLRARGPVTRPALRFLLSRWRQWDWIAAQRVDRYVANSRTTCRAHPPLPRPRVDRPASAGRDRPLLAGAGRRALRRARGADGAQAHRRRGRGVHPRSGCRSW